ncbi:MAG: hypothetical protein ACOCT0_05605 [Halobacteriota archaeon]
MYDREELEELRRGRRGWEGHVDREVKVERRTYLSPKSFFSAMGASTVLTVFVIALIVASNFGMALVGVTGIGGFQADISQLNGDNVMIYPSIGPTAACPSPATDGNFANTSSSEFQDNAVSDDAMSEETLPQLRADIEEAEVPTGASINLTKDIPTPIPGLDMVRVRLGQWSDAPEDGNISLGNTSFYVTGLRAERLEAFDTEIRESYSDGSSDNPRMGSSGEFVVEGTAEDSDNRVELTNASGRAHFLSFAVLEMPYLELEMEYFDTMPDDNVAANDSCPPTGWDGST